MAPYTAFLIAAVLFSAAINHCNATADQERKIYIVYMGALPKERYNAKEAHPNLLQQVLEGSTPQESLVYSYSKSFNGFAARLTDNEQKKLAGMSGVVSVFPSMKYELHTTNSWDFLGLPTTAKRMPNVESDVVIGIMDTGVYPDSESFSDAGLGPPPSKWKGICQNYKCNNKIIGARFYKADGNFTGYLRSPVDSDGHGTHIAATAAGREVSASFFGVANGTARGAVPSARIAVYKICYDGCGGADIMAAFDDAIADGVDVLSLSFGGAQIDFSTDTLALGAYHAMQKGIVVSTAAGNSGPEWRTLSNAAPWYITVGSSITQRRIVTSITLGNNEIIEGLSVNAFPTNKEFSPLLLQDSCDGGWDENVVKGKILVCKQYSYGELASKAGAQGMVIGVSDLPPDDSSTYFLPAALISLADFEKVSSYLNQNSDATALIHRSDSKTITTAPHVAGSSSRGPSNITPLILKPDIIAPGVEILAAWTPYAPVWGYSDDDHKAKFNFISGTSMACPHVSGAAAYVKSFHPTWSAAAIKSALMTTALPMKTVDTTQAEFSHGAGEVNPSQAVDPGLVYDTLESDYIVFFCNLGYTPDKIKTLAGQDVTCGPKNGTEAQLNYPSMTHIVNSKEAFTTSFPRRVTNVGSANSVYKATISKPDQINISVTPDVLSFNSLDEVQSFTVTVSGGPFESNSVMSASLTWSDGVYSVRSPIVVLVEIQ